MRFFRSVVRKIHPQLPLTQRECQQLLNLLNTSFRSQLDREHPAGPSETPLPSTTTQIVKVDGDRRLPSSYDSASEHIDSILSNPLVATRPQRRASDYAEAHVREDPLAWFLDQVALGTANIAKASFCIDLLQKLQTKTNGPRLSTSNTDQKPASVIAEWLRTSGTETSESFIILNSPPPSRSAEPTQLLDKLVPMLLEEGNHAPLWRWYLYRPEQDIESDRNIKSHSSQVAIFKARLLKNMIRCARTRDEAFSIFLRAYEVTGADKQLASAAELRSLQAAGGTILAEQISADTQAPCAPELYDSFTLSTHAWLAGWGPIARAMLCVYHPTHPDPQPGLKLIRDPDEILRLPKVKDSGKKLLVRLCLGVIQQLTREEKVADAQVAMEFIKEHFPHVVDDTKTPRTHQASDLWTTKTSDQKHVLMLDKFLLT